MLCLSGFELYSSWVPLICRLGEAVSSGSKIKIDGSHSKTHKKYRVTPMAQAFNFQKKTEKSLGNTMAVKFDVNRKKKIKKNNRPKCPALLLTW